MVQRPAAGSIPDAPGSYQFKDGQGRVLYVGKAKSLRSRLRTTSRRRDAAAAHPPDGGGRGDGRVDRGAQRGRGALPRVQPHQAPPAALQHPATRTTSPTRTSRSPSTRSGRGRWCCGARSARACGTSGRTRTRTRSARRSTCCCARSRSARARNDKFDRHQRLGRPCLYAHIEKCAAPCVGDDHPRGLRRARRRAARVPRRRHRAGARPARKQMHEASTRSSSSGRPALRDQLFSVRKAIERQQMVGAEGGGLRRHRHRRGPARGVGAGVLRAPRPRRRPQGPRRRQGRGRRPARARRPAPRTALRRRAGRRRSRARCSSRWSPRIAELYEEFLALRARARRSRSGCRSAARSASCCRP